MRCCSLEYVGASALYHVSDEHKAVIFLYALSLMVQLGCTRVRVALRMRDGVGLARVSFFEAFFLILYLDHASTPSDELSAAAQPC